MSETTIFDTENQTSYDIPVDDNTAWEHWHTQVLEDFTSLFPDWELQDMIRDLHNYYTDPAAAKQTIKELIELGECFEKAMPIMRRVLNSIPDPKAYADELTKECKDL